MCKFVRLRAEEVQATPSEALRWSSRLSSPPQVVPSSHAADTHLWRSTMKRWSIAIVIALLVAVPLVLAACGSSSDEATPAASPSPSMVLKDIVDTAVEAGDFTTLVSAVTAADLVDTLKGEGPYTVFAPTDAAFAAVPKETLDALLADPKGALTDVLTYHVASGKVMASDLSDGMMIDTVNGAQLEVKIKRRRHRDDRRRDRHHRRHRDVERRHPRDRHGARAAGHVRTPRFTHTAQRPAAPQAPPAASRAPRVSAGACAAPSRPQGLPGPLSSSTRRGCAGAARGASAAWRRWPWRRGRRLCAGRRRGCRRA